MKTAALLITILFLFPVSAFAEFPAVEVYDKSAKNVVLIIAKSKGTSSMIGAGSIISHSGLISTNAHVIVDKSSSKPYAKIRVFLKPDKVTGKFKKDLVHRHNAKVLAYDLDLDLAILQAEGIPSGLGMIELADPDKIRVGEEAVAIGHPEQGGLWTLTYGRISGSIEDQNSIKGKDVFQTDASVNRGNSGGPLLDKRGYMIGINSNMARLGAGDLPITGVNFAVKASVLKHWLMNKDIVVAYGKSDTEAAMTQPPVPVKTEDTATAAETAKPAEEATTTVKEETAPAAEEAERAVEKAVEQAVEPVQTEKETVKADPADAVEKEKEVTQESITKQDKPKELYQPHRKSYSANALLKAAEEELENMMDEMRIKIRR